MPAHLLVVEDEPLINQAVTDRLRAEGYAVTQAFTGPEAVAAADVHTPDAIVLDIMLPGFDGIEVCRRVQSRRPVPVIMLTARDDESDILVGLGAGADDYLTKPFRMRELVARVQALLRRVERAGELARTPRPAVRLGGLEIDSGGRRVRVDGTEVHLTPTEYDLLTMLASAPALLSHPQPALKMRLSASGGRMVVTAPARAVKPSTTRINANEPRCRPCENVFIPNPPIATMPPATPELPSRFPPVRILP